MERDKGIYMSKNGQFTYQAVSDFLNGKDQWCLIAAIDDASSDIPYIERKGIPYAIYVDKAGRPVDLHKVIPPERFKLAS
jgi:hypothetical protein